MKEEYDFSKSIKNPYTQKFDGTGEETGVTREKTREENRGTREEIEVTGEETDLSS